MLFLLALNRSDEIVLFTTARKLMDTSVDQLFKDREEPKQSPILEENTSGKYFHKTEIGA
jgi:hypothetical protein